MRVGAFVAPAAAAAVLLSSSIARAQACARPDVQVTFPPDDAKGVPTDAVLSARYAANAEYLDEEVTLERVGGESDPVPVTFDSAERMLSFTPPAGLEPGETYIVAWPKLRGLNSASRGRGAKVEFAVGSSPDGSPPTFEGVRSFEWDLVRDHDECEGQQTDRFEFDLRLGAASDDSGTESLALLVFQTVGPGEVAPEPIEILAFPDDGKARVRRRVSDALGTVCFAAVVRDLTGKSSTSGPEICKKTIEPPFFAGCSVTPRERARRHAGPAVLALALALGCRRRRA